MPEEATMKRPLKVTVIGDGTVGKTCLLIAYTTKQFPEEYVPTVFDNYSGEHTLGSETYSMTLWDTAGQEEYEKLRPLSYPQTNVFILCFALDNLVSFENVASKWVPELRTHCQNTPIILVGTKLDLRSSPGGVGSKRASCVRKRERLAAYVECSAKTGEGVHAVFDEAIAAAVGHRKRRNKCTIL